MKNSKRIVSKIQKNVQKEIVLVSKNRERKWQLVNFCEFDKYATKSYCAIHGVDESLNLGDITKVDETKLKPFNMICGGSPCQDFSIAGKQKGSVWTCKECGHEYNPLTVHWLKRDKCPCCGSNNIEKTRSSLLVEYLRVIRANKPNFGLYENVKNIVGKQFKETTFKLFTDELKEYDYNVYWKVLNAKNYGIPQNRERVYLIFIKKDLDNGKLKFPEPFDNGVRLKDMLEDKVDEKYYISKDKIEKFLKNFNYDFSKNQLGSIENNNSQTNRVYNIDKESPTLNTCSGGNHQPKVLLGVDKTFNNPKIIDEANCLCARYDCGFTKRVSEGTAVLESIPILVSKKGEKFDKKINEANTLLARDYKGFGNQTMNAVIQIPQATKKGYIECEQNGVADLSYPTSTTRRGRVQENGNISPTLTASETNICKIESLIRIRKLTPKEYFRLMGFSDNDFEKAEKTVSNSQLYKQAGNSIVVDVFYYILVELYKAMPYLFDDLKLSSFFSGIGAFEIALDRLYKGINSGNFISPQVD